MHCSSIHAGGVLRSANGDTRGVYTFAEARSDHRAARRSDHRANSCAEARSDPRASSSANPRANHEAAAVVKEMMDEKVNVPATEEDKAPAKTAIAVPSPKENHTKTITINAKMLK